jgi:uncharacterized protein YutE (UPF0331/DUF86 family)
MDRLFLEKKISTLAEKISKLGNLVAGRDADEIRRDEMRMDAIERNFQLSVDLMVDINTHIIKAGNLGTVDDFQSTFIMLGDSRVLDKDFATRVAPIVGARNMLVHRYEKLDKDLFLKNLKNNFSDFKTYISQINEYLKKSA